MSDLKVLQQKNYLSAFSYSGREFIDCDKNAECKDHLHRVLTKLRLPMFSKVGDFSAMSKIVTKYTLEYLKRIFNGAKSFEE